MHDIWLGMHHCRRSDAAATTGCTNKSAGAIAGSVIDSRSSCACLQGVVKQHPTCKLPGKASPCCRIHFPHEQHAAAVRATHRFHPLQEIHPGQVRTDFTHEEVWELGADFVVALPQGSAAWLRARLGHVSGSGAGSLLGFACGHAAEVFQGAKAVSKFESDNGVGRAAFARELRGMFPPAAGGQHQEEPYQMGPFGQIACEWGHRSVGLCPAARPELHGCTECCTGPVGVQGALSVCKGGCMVTAESLLGV